MPSIELDSLNLTAEQAAKKLGVSTLGASNPRDKLVMDEADLLMRWAGVTALVGHCSDGTAARTNGLVTVDRKQLDALFGKFVGNEYQTAIFFALAHEFGHLCQFKHFGVSETMNRPRCKIEAHADVLAGVWLGVRMGQAEPHTSDAVRAAGLQLRSGHPDYPTETQRAYLVQQGMALTAMLLSVEQKISGNYQSITQALREQDVVDLFKTASDGLDEIG